MAEQRIGKGATRVTGFVSKASFTPGENAEMKREAKRREAVTLIVAFISPLSFPQRLELDSFVDLITPPSPKDLLTLILPPSFEQNSGYRSFSDRNRAISFFSYALNDFHVPGESQFQKRTPLSGEEDLYG